VNLVTTLLLALGTSLRNENQLVVSDSLFICAQFHYPLQVVEHLYTILMKKYNRDQNETCLAAWFCSS
jgi:hypothetical protein